MHLTRHPRPERRAPDNELFDRGCDLVEAAMAIRELAVRDGAQRALPAVLGCVESALDSLAGATASAHASHATFGDEHFQRIHRGLVNLELALDDAKLAASAARGLARRVIAMEEL
jgi:hypothetical protein